MKTKLVEELMIPLAEYATVTEEATLNEVVTALRETHAKCDPDKHRHRAILVLNSSGQVVGKVSLIDILRSLEPKYDQMLSDKGPMHFGFTKRFYKAMIEQLKLWDEPLERICEKAVGINVKTIMATPGESEHVEAGTSLNEAIHQLVLGHHQSLLVTQGKNIIGILKLADIFEEVADSILTCEL